MFVRICRITIVVEVEVLVVLVADVFDVITVLGMAILLLPKSVISFIFMNRTMRCTLWTTLRN